MATFIYKGSSWTYNEVTAADGRVWRFRTKSEIFSFNGLFRISLLILCVYLFIYIW